MDEQRSAYTKRMNHYDDLLTGRRWWSRLYMRGLWGIDDNEIAREVLDMLPNDFAGVLLDVPVGTAVFTYEKYLRMTDVAQIVGLDYSEEMIEISKRRFGDALPPFLRFVQGDVGNLPFDDESFDAVLSMNGFQAFPDKSRAIREIYRVLKPNGLFFGCLYVRGMRRIPDWIARHVLEKKGFFMHLIRRSASTKCSLHTITERWSFVPLHRLPFFAVSNSLPKGAWE